MSIELEAKRGHEAAQLLENPLLREAFDTQRERIQREWEDSPARDTEGRERLWLMLKLLGAVEGHLKTVMETGKLATLEIERKKTLLERAKEAMPEPIW